MGKLMECILVLWTNGRLLILFFFFSVLCIVLILAVLCLCCCTWLSLVAASKVSSLVAVHGLLSAVASLVVKHTF